MDLETSLGSLLSSWSASLVAPRTCSPNTAAIIHNVGVHGRLLISARHTGSGRRTRSTFILAPDSRLRRRIDSSQLGRFQRVQPPRKAAAGKIDCPTWPAPAAGLRVGIFELKQRYHLLVSVCSRSCSARNAESAMLRSGGYPNECDHV